MEQKENNPQSGHSGGDQFIDQRTRDKIRKHLSDPNDKITEQDIANVDTDMYKRPETEEDREKAEEEKKKAEEELKKDYPPKAGSAWDILDT